MPINVVAASGEIATAKMEFPSTSPPRSVAAIILDGNTQIGFHKRMIGEGAINVTCACSRARTVA
jgi:hypothetical protein